MPRQKKSPPPAPEPKPGHNGAENAGRHLFFHHKRRIRDLEEKARLARNALSNAKKLATGELAAFDMSYDDIKRSFEMDSQGGEAAVLAEMQRTLRVMKWMGIGPGTQGDLFTDAKNFAAERLSPEERGSYAGLNGDSRDSNPYPSGDPDAIAWDHAYTAGENQLKDWQKLRDAESFDETGLGGGEKPPEDLGPSTDDDGDEATQEKSARPQPGMAPTKH